MKLKHILLSSAALLALSACGGGNSSSQEQSKIGVVYDNVIEGLSYKNAHFEGKTNHKGEFKYIKGEKTAFFIGKMKLGEIDINEDQKVFLTDILSLPRDDFANPKVLKLAQLIQGLDHANPNGDIRTISEKAEQISQSVFDENQIDEIAKQLAITLPNNQDALSELKDVYKEQTSSNAKKPSAQSHEKENTNVQSSQNPSMSAPNENMQNNPDQNINKDYKYPKTQGDLDNLRISDLSLESLELVNLDEIIKNKETEKIKFVFKYKTHTFAQNDEHFKSSISLKAVENTLKATINVEVFDDDKKKIGGKIFHENVKFINLNDPLELVNHLAKFLKNTPSIKPAQSYASSFVESVKNLQLPYAELGRIKNLHEFEKETKKYDLTKNLQLEEIIKHVKYTSDDFSGTLKVDFSLNVGEKSVNVSEEIKGFSMINKQALSDIFAPKLYTKQAMRDLKNNPVLIYDKQSGYKQGWQYNLRDGLNDRNFYILYNGERLEEKLEKLEFKVDEISLKVALNDMEKDELNIKIGENTITIEVQRLKP